MFHLLMCLLKLAPENNLNTEKNQFCDLLPVSVFLCGKPLVIFFYACFSSMGLLVLEGPDVLLLLLQQFCFNVNCSIGL